MSSEKTKYCPECGSDDIDWTIPQIWSKWECRRCGYIGPLILEDGNIAEVRRKEFIEKMRGEEE